MLLDRFSEIDDPSDVRRIRHPLPEILFLVVCGTIAHCDNHEDIAAWGAAHVGVLREHLPCAHGVPGERWLTIVMNRVNPALSSAAFAAWVRERWPDNLVRVTNDKRSLKSRRKLSGWAPQHLQSVLASSAT